MAKGLTVVKLQDISVDGRGHADGLAGEVRVEVEAFSERDPSRGLTVPSEQGEDIIFTTVPRMRSMAPQPLAQSRGSLSPPVPPCGQSST